MQKGFTIIEIVIAVFVLGIAVAGVFSAFSVVNILASDSEDRLTASYLAQEGMEIVRNIRDANWLLMDYCDYNPDCEPDPTWLSNQLDSCHLGECGVDYLDVEMDTAEDSVRLRVDVNGFYSYNDLGTESKYMRKITISPIEDVDGENDHIVKVTTKVSWDKRATIINPRYSAEECTQNNCITVEETLYNWYNYKTR